MFLRQKALIQVGPSQITPWSTNVLTSIPGKYRPLQNDLRSAYLLAFAEASFAASYR